MIMNIFYLITGTNVYTMHNKTSVVKYEQNVMFSTNKAKILGFFFFSFAYLKSSYSYRIKLNIEEYSSF